MTTPDNKCSGDRIAVARITIEALTPFIVSAGAGDDVRDSFCVVDANGLPTIPGSSIAGVLRHAMAGPDGPQHDARCQSLFGYQERNEGSASRLEVSWAQIHDEHDRPVPFRRAPASEFLAFLSTGVMRDHVRLNARGAAADKGKFDETLVPRGARFTFELLIEDPKDGEMDELLALVNSPALRLGGRSRRGLGAFKVVRIVGRTFDLTAPADRKAWASLPRRLDRDAPMLPAMKVPEPKAAGFKTIKVTLRPQDHWIFGGGVPDEKMVGDEGRLPDIAPVAEAFVVWEKGPKGDQGRKSKEYKLFPGSAVKGALRHRVAFHARRLAGAWASGDLSKDVEEDVVPEVEELFGRAKGDSGVPGRVFPMDVYLETGDRGVGHLDHVCIDRFTGAPMDGMLFNEAPLFKAAKPIELVLVVHGALSATAEKALAASLADLCEGRLALGGGANRGHGYFEGELDPGGAA